MEHYAARFAAKEALLKALGSGLNSEIKLNESEIINEKSGKPLFNFINESKKLLNLAIIKSLSHCLTQKYCLRSRYSYKLIDYNDSIRSSIQTTNSPISGSRND